MLNKIILIIMLAWSCFGAKYYISPTGSDANAGTVSSPLANCPGMDAYTGSVNIVAHDTVVFDRGGAWTIIAGTQGLYLTGGVTYIGNSWGTGARATIKAAQDCDAGIIRFRDHATVPTVFRGFVVDGDHYVSTGIDINHRYVNLMNGALKIIDSCEIKNTYSEQSQGEYKYGIIISNHDGTGGYCENVQILNTVVHDVSRDGICLYPGDENADCRIKNIVVRGCEVYSTGQDPNYSAGGGIIIKGYVDSSIIEYNYVHDTKGAGIFFNSNEDNHYDNAGIIRNHTRFNIVNCVTASGGIRIYDMGSGPDKKDLKIYGNMIFRNHITAGFYIDDDVRGQDNSIYFCNNLIFDTPIYINCPGATFTKFVFKNNIILYTLGTPVVGGSYFTDSSNNFIGNPGFEDTASLPTGFTSGAPNTSGFTVDQFSPIADAGATISALSTGSIGGNTRPVGAYWDIGPYERNSYWSLYKHYGNVYSILDTSGVTTPCSIGVYIAKRKLRLDTASLGGNWGPYDSVENCIAGQKYTLNAYMDKRNRVLGSTYK